MKPARRAVFSDYHFIAIPEVGIVELGVINLSGQNASEKEISVPKGRLGRSIDMMIVQSDNPEARLFPQYERGYCKLMV